MVYAFAAVASALALAWVPRARLWPIAPRSLGAVLGLALIPTLIGHTAVQAAARTTSPSVVALVSPMETIGALAIGAAWLGARPTTMELWGAAVILAGVMIGIVGARG
jgi:drug/metabolite transporter (DMT)-like permease